MTEISHLPTPGVILDLDTYERPTDEVKPPFVVTVGGRQVTFKDPGEIDWQDLAVVETAHDMIHYSLERDDREHIFKQKMPTYKFGALMKAYYDHYDLEEKLEAAKRQKRFDERGR